MMIALHCDRSSEDGNGENLFFEKKSAIMYHVLAMTKRPRDADDFIVIAMELMTLIQSQTKIRITV